MRIILWEYFPYLLLKRDTLNSFVATIINILRSYGAGQRVTNLKIYAILNLCKRRAPFGPPGLHDSNTGN
jgi:hypothetical protein